MNKNRLIIATAGSGKTTHLINEALKIKNEKVLITTYTEANEAEIKLKILKLEKSIPSNIKVQTWFAFLIQHGVKPFQGSLNDLMFDYEVRGLILVEGESAIKKTFKMNGRKINVHYKEEDEFLHHYFTRGGRIYSDKLAKFAFKASTSSKNAVIERISKIFPNIFIDEVQDLAGYDLEVIKLLFKSKSNILLVGDPRQVTYLTHLEKKNKSYREGKIRQYLEEKCKSLIKDGIDDVSLKLSHRNNLLICNFSSRLYPELPPSNPCACCDHKDPEGHEGIFFILSKDVNNYLVKYKPMQLRWNIKRAANYDFEVRNYGESKGLTFDRVLLYPTQPMIAWLKNNDAALTSEARAKLYVGITRAKYSVGIVFDYNANTEYKGVTKYKQSDH